jgi:uncharacterized protein (TIGR02145 family)
MAQNLDYHMKDSSLYNSGDNSCGKLYTWSLAMKLDLSCNNNACKSSIDTRHRGVCPENWHIPTAAEWEKLINSSDNSAKNLKAREGWKDSYGNPLGNGTNTSGFAAQPCEAYESGIYLYEGTQGTWWTTLENTNGNNASIYSMSSFNDDILTNQPFKTAYFSVRCIKN